MQIRVVILVILCSLAAPVSTCRASNATLADAMHAAMRGERMTERTEYVTQSADAPRPEQALAIIVDEPSSPPAATISSENALAIIVDEPSSPPPANSPEQPLAIIMDEPAVAATPTFAILPSPTITSYASSEP